MTIIKNVLFYGLLAFVAAVVFVLFLFPGTYNIHTDSMRQTLPVGTKVYTAQQAEYQVGDVISFRAFMVSDEPAHVVTHRLIGFNADGTLLTKGDANKDADAPAVAVTTNDILGKVVWQIPLVGAIQDWMKLNQVYIWFMAAGVVLLIFIFPSIKKLWADPEDDSASAESVSEKPSEELHPV